VETGVIGETFFFPSVFESLIAQVKHFERNIQAIFAYENMFLCCERQGENKTNFEVSALSRFIIG